VYHYSHEQRTARSGTTNFLKLPIGYVVRERSA
jgi:hypothetical protein